MARRPRVFAPHLLYHVIARGNHRQPTFLTSADYQAYLERLAKYRRECQVRLWAYCLMPNHVHLLLETGGPPLSVFMQSLQQSYTQYFNRTHDKVGHLFQGRYKAILCQKDRYLLALVRYIHLNPVRARLVEQPDAYAYSGHASYLTGKATAVLDPAPGLAIFGGPKAYFRFVHERMAEGHQAEYYSVADQRFLGDARFVEQCQKQEVDPPPTPRARRNLPAALKAVAAALDMDVATLRSADRSWACSRQRTLAAYLLIRRRGFRARDVADAVGRDTATLSVLLSRFAARLRTDPALLRQVNRLDKIVKL